MMCIDKSSGNKRILIVVAHPDDEVLGIGGTIAKYALAGHKVYCLFLGEGVTSRYRERVEAEEKEIGVLRRQAEKAATILGTTRGIFKTFPDNRFDSVPLLEIVKTVEEVKEEIEPDIVYTHHQGDLNVDHQITSKAVATAFRYMEGERVNRTYFFETPSSTECSLPNSQNFFLPNTFVDISETLENKIEALRAYQSEIRKYPHPRSPEALRAIAMRWGSVVGREYAEAFELVRAIE